MWKSSERTVLTEVFFQSSRYFPAVAVSARIFSAKISVVDPWHVGTDPDLRIRTSVKRIRMRIQEAKKYTASYGSGSGCESGRPKNIRILRIRIHKTGNNQIKQFP